MFVRTLQVLPISLAETSLTCAPLTQRMIGVPPFRNITGMVPAQSASCRGGGKLLRLSLLDSADLIRTEDCVFAYITLQARVRRTMESRNRFRFRRDCGSR